MTVMTGCNGGDDSGGGSANFDANVRYAVAANVTDCPICMNPHRIHAAKIGARAVTRLFGDSK